MLRDRDTRGELNDEQFEQELETVLETEDAGPSEGRDRELLRKHD